MRVATIALRAWPRVHARTVARLWLVGAAALAAAPAEAHAQGGPLTLTEVLDLRRRGVSVRQILRSVREYCIAFALTDSVEREITAVGPDTLLVGGIREACVVTTPTVELAPGVLLDDAFNGMMSALERFVSADRLCTARPDSAGVRVENRRTQTGCAIAYPFAVGATDVRLELTLAELSGDRGAMAALGFGRDSASWDQYSFGITSENRFELCQSVAGRCRLLVFEKEVAPIRGGQSSENEIAVEIRGREIVLYINDQRVGAHVASRAVAGSVTLGVGARTSAVFKRLRAERLDRVATSR